MNGKRFCTLIKIEFNHCFSDIIKIICIINTVGD